MNLFVRLEPNLKFTMVFCILGEHIFIVTVGEDSNVCLWRPDGKLLLKKKINSGATIWNLEFCTVTKTIFTSSSDGNISTIDIGCYLDKDKIDFIHEIKEVVFETDSAANRLDSEYISRIKYLDNGFMVGFSNTNILYFRKCGPSGLWRGICDLNKNKPSVLEVSGNRIAFARYEHVTILEFHNGSISVLATIDLPKSMIRSFHFLENTESSLVCDDKGKFVLLNVNYEILSSSVLPITKERWSTAALRLSNVCLVADRCGHLHCFQISDDNQLTLKTTLKNVHGSLGITKMKWFNETIECFLIQTTGHDSCQRTIEIDKTTFKLKTILTEKLNVLWIENYFTTGKNFYYFGFNDNHFVLSEKREGIIGELECGGGHRNWDYRVDTDTKSFHFLFVRNKKLYKFRIPLIGNCTNSLKFPHNNLHKRSCNVISSIGNTDGDTLLVSGGDDNILKVQRLTTSLEIIHLNDLFAHISNIRCMALIRRRRISPDSWLIVSGGGRSQLCFTSVALSPLRVKELSTFMLKSTDYERKKLGKTQEIDFDPETRFMTITFNIQNDDNEFKLIAGCSDGFVREFLINIQADDAIGITETKSIFYGRCLLNVHFIQRLNILITMATDGLICFWDGKTLETDNGCILKLKHHSSSVNCFDTQYDDEKKTLRIITGGDDQNVVISFLELVETEGIMTLKILKTISNPELHTAQVTGVKFVDNQRLLCSVGVDQVLYFLDYNTLSSLRKCYSCVADVKGLHIIPGNNEKIRIVIYGHGMEIIEYEK